MPSKAKKASAGSDLSFEDAVAKLEQIVDQMETDDLPLEKMLAAYEQGTRLVKACEDKLSAAEVKIAQLEKTLGGELKAQPLALRGDEEE